MTESVHVEPSYENRSAFALWSLSQDPMPTTTSTGFDVSLSLYPDVPAELLEGAYVDGFLYRPEGTPQPEPTKIVLGDPSEVNYGPDQGGDAQADLDTAATARRRRKVGGE